MKRIIVWQRLDFPGVEHFVFEDSGENKKASGHAVGVWENEQPFAIGYEVEINNDWRVTAFRVESLDGTNRQIAMNSDGNGVWFDRDGAQQAEFDGCFEIDITLTPFTNTLPVKRLSLTVGEQKRISVLYIELPEFNIKRVEQIYTRLGERVFVYEGYPKDFRAEIRVDEDGFVTDYPELFRRVYP